MTSHLDDGLLNELIDGEIPSSDLGPIQAHLASCPECRTRLAAAQEMVTESDVLIEALDADERPETRDERSAVVVPIRRAGRRWIPALAWAATIVIAVGVGYAVRRPVPPPITPIEVVNTPVQADPAPAPSRTDIAAADAATRRIMRPAPPPATAPAVQDVRPVPQEAKAMAANGALASDAVRERTPLRVDTVVQRPLVVADSPRSIANAAPPQAPPAAGAMGRGGRGGGRGGDATARSATTSLVPRDEFAARLNIAPPDTISFPDAIRLLGGSLKLIDGMVPLRLEVVAGEVRVVYPLTNGQLVLAQRVVDGRLSWRLIAPPGIAADSLDKLRARVRE